VLVRQESAMAALHLSKVAVGCASLDALRRRQGTRVREGVVPVRTRFRPKRSDELVGGSLFWIISHRIKARNRILGFERDEVSGATIIRLAPELVRVREVPKRAHQGWRYLAATDAPIDLDALGLEDSGLPPALLAELDALALV
jgi:hypothetical protein